MKSYLLIAGAIYCILLSPARAANLFFGQAQTGTISSSGQSNSYTFTARANDLISLTVVTTGGRLLPRVRLYGPSGMLLGEGYDGNGPDCATGSVAEVKAISIPVSGAYTILVGGCGETGTGEYVIYAESPNQQGAADRRTFAGHGSMSGRTPTAMIRAPSAATPPLLTDAQVAPAPATSQGIVYTCDPTITALSATACNYLNTTIASLYRKAFTNANANIYVTTGDPSVFGNSSYSYNFYSYSNYRNTLIANHAGATLPATDPYGGDSVGLEFALQRALGLSNQCSMVSGGCYDGVITIGRRSDWYFRNGLIAANQYDFFSLMQHETDEILGTPSCAFNDCGSGVVFPADYFRYHSNGTHSLAPGSNHSCSSSDSTNACFSLDGVHMLQQYNNVLGGGDAGDWVTNCSQPLVQDEAICSGTQGVDISPAAEIAVLAAIGYTLRPPSLITSNFQQDVFLQFPDGSMGVWQLSANGRQLSIADFAFVAGASSGISLLDVADLNGDGVADLILQFTDSSIGVWYLGGSQGTTITGFAFIAGPVAGWKPVGLADLNGDGHPDMVIQNTNGTIGVWYLGGAMGNQIQGFAPISGPLAGWKVVGVADLNNDGHPDVVLQFSDGTIGVWYMSGAQGNQITGFAVIAGASTWSVVGMADLDGDGHRDLLIRNADGTLGVWYLGGTQGNQINGFAPITIPGNINWHELGVH